MSVKQVRESTHFGLRGVVVKIELSSFVKRHICVHTRAYCRSVGEPYCYECCGLLVCGSVNVTLGIVFRFVDVPLVEFFHTWNF